MEERKFLVFKQIKERFSIFTPQRDAKNSRTSLEATPNIALSVRVFCCAVPLRSRMYRELRI